MYTELESQYPVLSELYLIDLQVKRKVFSNQKESENKL
jgi:hypothetical protein